jgi:hypothetical protein
MTTPMLGQVRDLLGRGKTDPQTRVLLFTGGLPGIFIQQ